MGGADGAFGADGAHGSIRLLCSRCGGPLRAAPAAVAKMDATAALLEEVQSGRSIPQVAVSLGRYYYFRAELAQTEDAWWHLMNQARLKLESARESALEGTLVSRSLGEVLVATEKGFERRGKITRWAQALKHNAERDLISGQET